MSFEMEKMCLKLFIQITTTLAVTQSTTLISSGVVAELSILKQSRNIKQDIDNETK